MSLARNRWIPITPNTPPTTTPPQPATRSARNRSFVIPQTTASNMRPPSTGNPGSAFNPAKSRLRNARFLEDLRQNPVRACVSDPEDPRKDQRAERAGGGDQERCERSSFARMGLRVAAPEDQRDPVHRQIEHARRRRVRELVEDDAPVEQDRVHDRPPEGLLIGQRSAPREALVGPVDDERREDQPGDRDVDRDAADRGNLPALLHDRQTTRAQAEVGVTAEAGRGILLACPVWSSPRSSSCSRVHAPIPQRRRRQPMPRTRSRCTATARRQRCSRRPCKPRPTASTSRSTTHRNKSCRSPRRAWEPAPPRVTPASCRRSLPDRRGSAA